MKLVRHDRRYVRDMTLNGDKYRFFIAFQTYLYLTLQFYLYTDAAEAWPAITEEERIQHQILFYSQGPVNGHLLGNEHIEK